MTKLQTKIMSMDFKKTAKLLMNRRKQLGKQK